MSSPIIRTGWYLFSLLPALLSAFFVFYTIRLLYVTRLLSAVRGGGKGAYIGAAVFPLLAALVGWIAWGCVKAARRA
ncbi:MAG TPA: hypothetical protein VFC63_09330 [Blastocatellia bacterium]|nr:hypothetical protein [Blastocatellia bacterium]